MKRSTKLVLGLALAVFVACVLWMALQRNKGTVAAVYTPSPTPAALASRAAARGPTYADRLTGTPVLGPQLTATPEPDFDLLGYTDPDDEDYGMI